MYAFAIWDELEQTLTLARDPLGIKPLYYAEGDGDFYFASEVKALLQAPGVDLREQPAGHVGFFVWGSVPEPYTLYRGIYSCPSGSYTAITPNGRIEPRSFYSLTDEVLDFDASTSPKTQDESLARLHEALRESVEAHLISDTPVAIFLSAGIDSGVITALASESRQDLQCLTLGTDRTRNTLLDETGLAGVVARTYGLGHQSRFIDQATFSSECDRMLNYMDQPTVDGVNVYFISWLARECGFKVALSGLGGDELFGGYPSFTQIPTTVRSLGFTRSIPFLGRGWRTFSAKALSRWTSPKYASLFEYGGTYGGACLLRRGLYMPWELPTFLDADLVRDGWRELASVGTMNAFLQPLDGLQPGPVADFLRVSTLEIRNYMRTQLLRDSDWAGMAHSLEIRVPMVDITLLRQIAPLRASSFAPRKPAFVAALKTPLPAEILNRPKSGFALPVREWM
jgi:asparagine synthase (glutamine-hydrolysing)